ncbi:MAG TPA: 3-mercaptopyruvate sulfurtransferase [Geminicoccaceae bacterium]|nr:3-mercaptopyruvate sulfurtransferase [Geminicoccaceae bacterium]
MSGPTSANADDDPRGLVSTAWLAERLGTGGDLRVLDATWLMPALGRDARREHVEAHIPGAVYFDIDRIADTGSPLPHMLPSADKFAAEVGALGVGDGEQVVVYDGNNYSASARVWWMFRAFGHDRVAVLDGGLARWRAEGRPVETGLVAPRQRRFVARPRPDLVRDLPAVRANLDSRREQVIDARARGRFEGTAPEPRPGLRPGHIPGSLNLPYTDLIDPADGTLLDPDRIRERLAAAGIDPGRPAATTCGSGVTACVVSLALHRIGRDDVPVYDGSWTEWGGRPDTPVETG